MRKRMMMTLAAMFIAAWVGAEQTTLYTIEDAYIKSDEAETNFGDDEFLWARDQTFMQLSYIKFDTSALGTVTNIDAISGYAYNISYDRSAAVYLMTNSAYTTWSENSITWSNAPGNNTSTRYLLADAGLLIGSFVAPTVTGVLDMDWNDVGFEATVIDAMNTQDSITLVLVRPGDRYAKFASKESTDTNTSPFQIVIDAIPVSTTFSNTVVVSQDSTIKPDPDANTNFGSDEKLSVNDGGMNMAYIQFVSPAYEVTDILSMTAYSDIITTKPRGSSVYLITSSTEVVWNQNTITWNNAPANNTASKYPDSGQAVVIGSFAAPAASTKQTVDFTFNDAAAKALLIDTMNAFDSVTLVLVRPSDQSAAYSSLENVSTVGSHPIQMDVIPEPATFGMMGLASVVIIGLRRLRIG